MSMRRCGVIALLGAALLDFVAAQGTTTTLGASTTYVPTQTWTPNAVCSAGSNPVANPGGGVYTDDFGSYWEMGCGQQFAGWSLR
jgi:hypothetical protein